MRVFESIGAMLLKVSDYIYSMTSSMLGGEEIPPEELKERIGIRIQEDDKISMTE